MERIDLVGKRFGLLTVIALGSQLHNPSGGTDWTWDCVCDCGSRLSVRGKNLRSNQQKSCGCSRRQGTNNKSGELTQTIWGKILRCAQRNEHAVEIIRDEAWDLFLKQSRCCALTNILLILGQNASLDRRDSSYGYVSGNVQWVHKDVNIMKNVWSQDYFIFMCHKVAGVHPKPSFDNGEMICIDNGLGRTGNPNKPRMGLFQLNFD